MFLLVCFCLCFRKLCLLIRDTPLHAKRTNVTQRWRPFPKEGCPHPGPWCRRLKLNHASRWARGEAGASPMRPSPMMPTVLFVRP